MSWFKRVGERRSPESVDQAQNDTDPNTCLEVFQNHWKQAWMVIGCQDKKTVTNSGHATADGVETVLRNLEQMVTLLANEDDDGGLPGPILRHVLESELLEKVCSWCTINVPVHDKLRMQQLRLFELIISQSKQLLLIHRPVIKPLLRLLIDVADSPEISNGELEFKLVLVLHQICICISQQNLILESFFSTDTDHGPARFLIFSLLIPYIHREGPVGQKARDALLLIMTLSARHPHIGHYIANNSDFCPVLATGLSGLYSSLPRKITPPSDDWYAITWEDCLRIPDLQMFLNSLQFLNAVVQVAHPLVRKQLIEFIYSGFLVPVLAPALHQISREEVMTATVYLDMFIRHVSEPHLLKAVLRFVLVEKYDDVPVLDSLLSRISSNTHLSTVTLALFYTLIALNCEDIMFQLVFRYLVPCTHVMVSQRRSVRDLDLYSKSAEKFLSLRPKCCSQHPVLHQTTVGTPAPPPHLIGLTSQRRPSITSISTITGPSLTLSISPLEAVAGTEARQWETSYFEYLHDARNRLEQTLQACHHWTFPYDGENPPPDSITNADTSSSAVSKGKGAAHTITAGHRPAPATGYIEVGTILNAPQTDSSDINKVNKSAAHRVSFDVRSVDLNTSTAVALSEETCNKRVSGRKLELDPKLYANLESVDAFMNYLNELHFGLDDEPMIGTVQDLGQCVQELEDLLKSVPSRELSRTSLSGDDRGDIWNRSSNSVNVSMLSPLGMQLSSRQSQVLLHDASHLEFSSNHQSANEDVLTPGSLSGSSVTMQNEQLHQQSPTLEDEPLVPHKPGTDKDVSVVQSWTDKDVSVVHSGTDEDVSIVQSLDDHHRKTSSPASPEAATTNRERNVPTDLPTPLKSNSSPLPGSVFSPMKSTVDMLSPFRLGHTPADEFPVASTSSPVLKKLKYLNDPPNIGPFLSAVFARLEGMISNSLYFNLLLTGVLSRLAAYPQPLLRSFLLNQNLVFQPSVKSLIQVLASLRQKVDNISVTVKHFESLVDSARHNLAQREYLVFQTDYVTPGPLPSLAPQQFLKPRADTITSSQPIKEKRKVTLGDLIFRRSPGREKMTLGKGSKKQPQTEQVQATDPSGYPYFNSHGGPDLSGSSSIPSDGNLQSLTTWNAVYCALVLDEFLKELAALSQEHSVLHCDEGYLSS
ncbi:hypothetical protein BsWGS_27087 [Bradybaena similaris]